jgi:hypothetical protein
MNADDQIHKPILGRMQLAVMRLFMRFVNAASALKRRVTASVMRIRAAN